LVVVDTPTAFSPFGHAVILFRIQVGGLNIMVLSGFAALLLGKGLGVRGERALGDVLDLPTARSAQQLAVAIVLSTLVIEAVGAGLLALPFAGQGSTTADALWKGMFHSVSAFCNAGFALQSDSLTVFQQQPFPLLVVAGLITLGGLGFSTLGGVWMKCRGVERRLSTQVKLVLAVSIVLVATGTAWFAVAEWGRSLAGLTPADKWVNALFQSVTTRTAGFSSVDLTLLHPSSVLMIIAWMFVGASSGGTGGGIKTTTLAVLLGAVAAISRGTSRVVLFGRTIGAEIVLRSVAIAIIAGLMSLGAVVAIVSTQDLTMDVAAFEVVSALGTVGLSLGATAQLDEIGKLIITLVMFVGRIGPLTLALLLARSAVRRVEYPQDRIMVG
jgi:trk system potassium uptake protein TrkH